MSPIVCGWLARRPRAPSPEGGADGDRDARSPGRWRRAARRALPGSLLVACLGVPEPADAPPTSAAERSGTIAFQAEADARVERRHPGSNYGAESWLFSDGSPSLRSYLRFEVTGLPGTVQHATLRLYCHNGSWNGPALYRTAGSWSEQEVTWRNAPPAEGSALDDAGRVPRGEWLELDATWAVQGAGTLDFVLVSTSSNGTGFGSRESGHPPQLVITTGPPPPPPPDGCPDGTCGAGETCGSCPEDCGTCPVGPLPAFPGAEGFGSTTPGGRGGRVIPVTNLDDDGEGSLRAALTARGPRIVVLRVAGTIEVQSRIEVTEPFLTLAGQTAPGGGITIKNAPSTGRGALRVSTHDVIVRHIRVRNSPSPDDDIGTNDTFHMSGPGIHDVIVDHCSFSWGTDEVFQTGGAHDFTVQWSIVAEGLDHSTHVKGRHSKGMHFREAGSDNISVHHNLLAHNLQRNPDINTTGVFDLVNNVFYDAGHWTEVKDKFGEPRVNIVANTYREGPSSTEGRYEVYYGRNLGLEPRVYVLGNIGFHRPTDDLPEEAVVREDSRWMIVDTPFPAWPVTTVGAVEALELVLADAGATRPERDAHDARIVGDVRNGTGGFIDDPSEVGGWLEMPPGTAPPDGDGDGMPDAWEAARGLDPADGSDGPEDADGDRYTNVEEYLNGTD